MLLHSLGKSISPNRISGLEERAGLKAGTLIDMFSGDTVKTSTALKEFNNLAENIIKNPTNYKILENGRKEVYWKSSFDDPKKGIGVIKYDGKVQTVMGMRQSYFNNKIADKK